MPGSFTFVNLVERLERNNLVHPIQLYYHSKTSDELLHYWPRDWKDMRSNGWQQRSNLNKWRGPVHLFQLDAMSFTINGEITIWIDGVLTPELSSTWEMIDERGGKPQPDGLGNMVPTQHGGGIMYNFTSRSMSRVYKTILKYAGEWVES